MVISRWSEKTRSKNSSIGRILEPEEIAKAVYFMAIDFSSAITGDIMKITYINHSGFLVETRDCYYIFDYFKGDLPYFDKKKEVIVFCSHFHEDHFNPQIFGILDDMGMTY